MEWAPPASSLASFVKSEGPASDFHSPKCLELDLCGLCFLSFSLVSVTCSSHEELGFSSLKRKGKCPDFLCASHFSFVYSTPVSSFSSLKCFLVHGIFISVMLTIVSHNLQKPIFKAEAKKTKQNPTLPLSLISPFCVDY